MRPRRAAIATKFTIRPHTHSRRDPCRVLSLLGLVPNWGKEEGLLQQFMIESHNHSTEPVLCYYCCDKKHNGRVVGAEQKRTILLRSELKLQKKLLT